MLSIDSAHPQKVDGMHRNQWTTYSGFGGRLAPESVVAFDRITQDEAARNKWIARIVFLGKSKYLGRYLPE